MFGPKSTVKMTHEVRGAPPKQTETTFDAFQDLFKGDASIPLSSVSANYTKGRDFNSEKVSFHVTVHCKQTEESINEAGKRAFMKSMEFMKDALEVLGWEQQS